MRILNTLLGGAVVALLSAAPVVATARDNVYFNFGYSSGYPAQRYYPAPPRHYFAPPVVIAAPVHPYYAPAPAYYYVERCPPRRYHSLNRHWHRDEWGPRYRYRQRGFDDGDGYVYRDGYGYR